MVAFQIFVLRIKNVLISPFRNCLCIIVVTVRQKLNEMVR